MSETFVYSLAFLFSFTVSVGSSWLAWTWLSRPATAKREEGTRRRAEEASRILRQEVLSTLSFFGTLLARFPFANRLKVELAEANLNWSVGRTVAMMLLAGAVTLNVFLRFDIVPLIGAWILALGAATTPVLYVRRRRAQHFRKLEEQLPEALDYLSRALVAGHSLPMSMELLAEEAGPPLATELRKTVDEYNLGLSMEDALRNLAARLPTVDIQFFVSAILTQSRTGGNLHELLENLADTIRERASLKGQVRALTANGRLTAIVLSLLPVALGIVMLLINSEYFMKFVAHPIGKMLLFAAIAGQVLAYFVIRKIVDIKV